MELGKQIYELRKKANLSQEQLAEKVGVSRQTISKWELGETAPDIKQAQALSQVFSVSLDELTGNDTKEVIYKKVSNTEKLAGLIIKVIKILPTSPLSVLPDPSYTARRKYSAMVSGGSFIPPSTHQRTVSAKVAAMWSTQKLSGSRASRLPSNRGS